MNKKLWKMGAGFLAFIGLLCLTGCSRSVLNYQIAESIGTLGKYENNEPVETPKMKMQREQREQESEEEQELLDILAQADQIALGYEYDQAISFLRDSEIDRGDERVTAAIADYESRKNELKEYEGSIPHLSFSNLIVDPSRALSEGYGDLMITQSEFEKILNELYENGYLLIDIHSLVKIVEGDEGKKTFASNNPKIPEGKKPLILSIDNLNYDGIQNGKGIALRLVLNDDGEVKALYTDEGGHDKVGDYDVIPVLEAFIEEHPDFSFQGAKGIVGVSGAHGAFGYEVEENGDSDYSENQRAVRHIAEKLIETGWTLACESYSYDRLESYSFDQLAQDITHWESAIGSLTGKVDTLIFPYGSEIDYTSEKAAWLANKGYVFLLGLWADQDFREVTDLYMRQTRRMVNGYVLKNSPGSLSEFFAVDSVIDESRY